MHVQQDLLSPGIILTEPEHQLRISAPEPVDRLIIISYHKQIVLRKRQHPENIVLYPVAILEFVYQNVSEPYLPHRQYIGTGDKKFITYYGHIVKVDLPQRFSLLFVFPVYITECLSAAL